MSDTLLSVQEFASQLEVDKHASQIYGWMKRGLPFELVDGKKRIPFEKGLAWIQERAAKTRKEKLETRVVEGRLGKDLHVPGVKPGTFLRWNRGNNLGPAYALVQKKLDGLVQLSVDYRPTPVYLDFKELLRDISKSVVTVVHVTEVTTFLLAQLSRLDFLTRLVVSNDEAEVLLNAIEQSNPLPADYIERMRFDRRRRNIAWPNEVQGEADEEDQTNE